MMTSTEYYNNNSDSNMNFLEAYLELMGPTLSVNTGLGLSTSPVDYVNTAPSASLNNDNNNSNSNCQSEKILDSILTHSPTQSYQSCMSSPTSAYASSPAMSYAGSSPVMSVSSRALYAPAPQQYTVNPAFSMVNSPPLSDSDTISSASPRSSSSLGYRKRKAADLPEDEAKLKRERNRLAAEKCRKKKLQTIEVLSVQVTQLQAMNSLLEREKCELLMRLRQMERLLALQS